MSKFFWEFELKAGGMAHSNLATGGFKGGFKSY